MSGVRISAALIAVLLAAVLGSPRFSPVPVRAANPPDPAKSSVQAQTALVINSDSYNSAVSVRLLDANGASVAGDAVTLTGSLVGGGMAHASIPPPPAGVTSSSGIITFLVSDLVAETVQFTAVDTTAGVTLLQTASVAFVPPSPYGVSLSPGAQSVDTGNQFTVSVNAVAPGTSAGSVTVAIAYDSTALQAVSCTPTSQGSAACNAAQNPVIVTGVNTAGYSSGADIADIVFQALDPSGAQTWITPQPPYLSDPSGQPLPASFATPASVTFMTAASASNSTAIVAGPAVIPADGVTSVGILVTLRDAASPSNPLFGKSVTLAASGGHSQITPVTPSTDGDGISTFRVSDATAETVTYTATDTTDTPNVVVTQQASVTFIPGPAAVANSSLVASPGSVVADGSSSATITVTAKDAKGNALAGASVLLYSALVGGGAPQSVVSPNPPVATANSAGVATFSVTDGAVENVQFTATVGTTPLTGLSAQVNFVAGAPKTSSPVILSRQYVSTDTPNAGTITVTLIDSYGHLVANDPVSLTQTAGAQSVITPASVSTDSGGKAVFSVTDTNPETVTYTITAANLIVPSSPVTLAAAPQVTFTIGAPSATQSTVTTTATSLAANGSASATITVTAKDSHGHVLPTLPILLTQVLPGVGYGHSAVAPSNFQQANASGVATFTVTDTTAESIDYVPMLTNVPLNPGVTVTFLAGPMSGSASTLTAATPLVTADGLSSAQLTVRLRDSFGNAVSGDGVTLTQNTGAHSVITSVGGTPSQYGIARFDATDTHAETVVYTATDSTTGTPVSGSAQVTFAPGPGAASASTITPASQSIQANGTPGTIAVVLEDANHNPISGAAVALSAGGGHSTISPAASLTTDANGRVSFTVADGTIENVTYTVADPADSLTLGSSTVSFVAAGPMTISGTTSTFTYGSRTIAASVGSTACASTTQTYTSTFSISLPGSCSTGVITFTVSGQAAGLQTSSGGTCLSFTADTAVTSLQIVVGGTANPSCPPPSSPVSPLASTVTVAPTTVVADGVSAVIFTVTLKNGSGSPVSGKTVTLGQSLQSGGTSHSTLTAINSTTDSNGQAVFTATDATVENVSYTADDVSDTTAIGSPQTVSFVAAPATGPMTVKGTTSTFVYTSRAISASVGGSPCASVTQTATSSFSIGLPSFCPAGAVTFTVGGQVAGLQTSTSATCLPFTANTTVSGVTVTPGGTPQSGCAGPGPVNLATSSAAVQPTSVTADGSSAATIIVALEDAGGNPVPGKAVGLTQALAQGGAPHSVLSSASGTTGPNGEALFKVTDATVENIVLTVQDTTDSLTLSQQPAVSFVPQPPPPPHH